MEIAFAVAFAPEQARALFELLMQPIQRLLAGG
jgi:hypothetical protein